MSAVSARSFYGDELDVTYYYSNAPYSTTAEYYGTLDTIYSLNLDSDSIFSTASALIQYDIIVYKFSTSYRNSYLRDIHVLGLTTHYGEYARGGFICSGYDWPSGSNLTSSNNSRIDYPNNYMGSFQALSANASASANLSDYYGWFRDGSSYSSGLNPTYNQLLGFRVIAYEFISGGDIGSVYWDNLKTDNNGNMFIGIICPYVGGSMSSTTPQETTTTSNGSSSGSSGGQTIINNNVDLTETHSILGGISNFLEDIWEAIRGIPSSILQGIQGIFVPSEGFMDEQLEELQESFAWYDDIKTIGTNFTEAFNLQAEASAPVISIPSIGSHGHVYTSEAEIVLDLSEYQEAVLSVRTILAILLWIFFLWRLYGRLPDIIHGGGMIIGDGSRIMDEMDNRATQSVFNDIDYHANSILQGTMPDISYIDNPDHVDWRV